MYRGAHTLKQTTRHRYGHGTHMYKTDNDDGDKTFETKTEQRHEDVEEEAKVYVLHQQQQ